MPVGIRGELLIGRWGSAGQSTSGALATGAIAGVALVTLLHGRRLSLLRERRKEGGPAVLRRGLFRSLT